MSTQPINDGGSAFPCDARETPTQWEGPSNGMSLRDYFAGQAMPAILSNLLLLAAQTDKAPSAEMLAKVAAEGAYGYADALLAARGRS